MIVGVMGTALISPLYALYKEAWHLQASEVSQIYVIYMLGALLSLLFLGRLPDRLGFRPVMKWALILVLTGSAISLVAWNTTVLDIGRFLVGIASSLMTTAATVAFATLARPEQMPRVAMLTSLLLACGFGLGPLLGGVMGQWAPAPLTTTYIPILVLGGLGLLTITKVPLPEHAVKKSETLQWKDMLPKLTWPGSKDSSAFALTTVLPFLAFGIFGLYASMMSLFLDKLVPWHGPVVSGSAIAVLLFVSACVQTVVVRIPTHWCGALGLAGMVVSNVLLMINLRVGSGTLFMLGVLVTSVSHAMSMLAGMNMVTRISTADNRSGLFATYLVIGYIGSMLPVTAMGWIADRWGMNVAVNAFCLMVITVGSIVAFFFLRHPRIRAPYR